MIDSKQGKKVYVRFERVAQLLAISAIDRENSIMEHLGVHSRELYLKFSDYAKSQVHLILADDLYGRSLSEYAKCWSYLKYGGVYKEEAEKVLRYFYHDMAMFLIHNPYNVVLHLEVDAALGEEVGVDVQDARKQILNVVNSGDTIKALQDCEYAGIFDETYGSEDMLGKLDSYATAAVLLKLTKEKRLFRFKEV